MQSYGIVHARLPCEPAPSLNRAGLCVDKYGKQRKLGITDTEDGIRHCLSPTGRPNNERTTTSRGRWRRNKLTEPKCAALIDMQPSPRKVASECALRAHRSERRVPQVSGRVPGRVPQVSGRVPGRCFSFTRFRAQKTPRRNLNDRAG